MGESFVASGKLPRVPDEGPSPRPCGDDLPAVSAVINVQAQPASNERATFVVGYDDIESVKYFGEEFKGLWTRTYDSIENAMSAAGAEYEKMLAKSNSHDEALLARLAAAGGTEYAQLCALSYRQTLAATKLVWNDNRTIVWNFLKEISTNGDMQTMDVIFPASPMLLCTNPDLLKMLLEPVLAYANNETFIRFGNPYSPHQLGTYPIADAPTSAQEPMPLENSGNMMFMLLAIAQAQNYDVSWLEKYFPMLRAWADRMMTALPYPAFQLCTDDFTGRLANNTNLGAKGIVALEAFTGVCKAANFATDCDKYTTAARGFAKTWKQYALEDDHFKIAYDFPNSYSIKYNMVWQKLLGMDGPFDWDTVVP